MILKGELVRDILYLIQTFVYEKNRRVKFIVKLAVFPKTISIGFLLQ